MLLSRQHEHCAGGSGSNRGMPNRIGPFAMQGLRQMFSASSVMCHRRVSIAPTAPVASSLLRSWRSDASRKWTNGWTFRVIGGIDCAFSLSDEFRLGKVA